MDAQPDDPEVLVQKRRTIVGLIRRLAGLCAAANARLTGALHPNVRPTVAPRNVVLMKELDFVCGRGDVLLWCDYCSGLPMLGYARHSPTMMQRPSKPPDPPLSDEELDLANASCIKKIGPSGNADLDHMAWAKTCEEFTNGSLIWALLFPQRSAPWEAPSVAEIRNSRKAWRRHV